jgi:hypothetical protein
MFAHAGEAVSRQVPKNRRVTILPAHPKCAKTHFLPLEYIEDFFGPRTTQMAADRSPQ